MQLFSVREELHMGSLYFSVSEGNVGVPEMLLVEALLLNDLCTTPTILWNLYSIPGPQRYVE